MRVLIDECLNWRLGRALTGHHTISVQRMGWSGVQNGNLIRLAEENRFDVFLTGDRNLAYQQDIDSRSLAIIVLEAPGTELSQTLPLMPKVLAIMAALRPGQIVRVGL